MPAISARLPLPLFLGEQAVRKIAIVFLAAACVAGGAFAESVTYVLETPGIV